MGTISDPPTGTISNVASSSGVTYGEGTISVGLGINVVVNGGFATDTVWTKGTGWSIGSGIASKTAGTLSNLGQTGILTIGVTYQIIYTVSGYSAGSMYLAGSFNGAVHTANGTYTQTLPALTADLAIQGGSTFAGSIDDVSVRRVY